MKAESKKGLKKIFKIVIIIFTGIILSLIMALTIFKKQTLQLFVPEIKSIKNLDIHFNGDSAIIDAKLLIINKGFLKIFSKDSISYKIKFNNKSYAFGAKKLDIHLYSGETDTLQIPLKVLYKDIHEGIRKLKGTDSVSYKLEGVLYKRIPFIGIREIPISHAGKTRVPLPIDIEISKINPSLDKNGINIRIILKIRNQNPNKIVIEDINYSLVINNLLKAEAIYPRKIVVKPKDVTYLEIPAAVKFEKIGQAIGKIINDKDNYKFTFKMEGTAKSDYFSKIDNTSLKIERSGQFELIK